LKFTRFLLAKLFLTLIATALVFALFTYQSNASLARATQQISPLSAFDNSSFASTQNEDGFILYKTDQGVECREASPLEARMFSPQEDSIGLHRISPIHTNAVDTESRGLQIVLRATQQLERFPEA
jgi:hypothetical protein